MYNIRLRDIMRILWCVYEWRSDCPGGGQTGREGPDRRRGTWYLKSSFSELKKTDLIALTSFFQIAFSMSIDALNNRMEYLCSSLSLVASKMEVPGDIFNAPGCAGLIYGVALTNLYYVSVRTKHRWPSPLYPFVLWRRLFLAHFKAALVPRTLEFLRYA